MDTVNIPLLRDAVEWAEAEAKKPEIDRQWFQGAWVADPSDMASVMLEDTDLPGAYDAQVEAHCGTAYCIAGYVGQKVDSRYATTDYVDDVHVSEVARDALGLSEADASDLFDGGSDIVDVRRVAERIAGQPL